MSTPSISEGPAPALRQPRPRGDRPALLLALSVHWDDCSVALGTPDDITAEVWSRQPERTAGTAATGGSPLAPPLAPSLASPPASPLASRDALLLLDRLLLRTDTALSAVDVLCFGRGPGAFTSLRVAAGLVQGLALAASLPVVGICSLAALAALDPGWKRSAPDRPWLQLSALDARMGECYFGLHECRRGHHPVPVISPSVGRPGEAVAVFERALEQHAAQQASMRLAVAGNGFALLPELQQWCERAGFDPREAAGRSPTAAAVLALAASVGAPEPGPAHTALPVYIRDKIALDLTEQRAGAAARASTGTPTARS